MLRIFQLNAGSFFEPDWDRRRHEIVAWIDATEADVVCLQEVWGSETSELTAQWIADEAAAEWFVAFEGLPVPAHHSPDPSVRFGSAVLTRWPIERQQLHHLPADPASPELSGFPHELLHVMTAGLDVFSTHLSAAPEKGDHRRAQVVAIDELIKVARGGVDRFDTHGERHEGTPIILCGDFNAEPESDEIRFLSGLTMIGDRTTFYQDAWRVAGSPGDPGYTQDWRNNELAADLNVHRKRIDYVFVGDAFRRAGDAGRVVAAKVVCTEPLTGVQASDHAGLLVDIEWPDRPTP